VHATSSHREPSPRASSKPQRRRGLGERARLASHAAFDGVRKLGRAVLPVGAFASIATVANLDLFLLGAASVVLPGM